jgi:hypothetical protein
MRQNNMLGQTLRVRPSGAADASMRLLACGSLTLAQPGKRMEPQNRRISSLASLAIYADEPAAHPPPRWAARSAGDQL